MANLRIMEPLLTFLALGLALLSAAVPATAKNCSCKPNFCCSKFGYCGTTIDYCGDGCQSGPCQNSGGPPSGGGSVGSVVTDGFFNGIKSKAGGSGCPGTSFYTRQAFLDAAGPYPAFGTTGSVDDGKREIAAFFAHVTHETGSLCKIDETNPTMNYCDKNSTQWPCYPGKKYYGRGPLQISWNYNYGPAGKSIGFDGLKSPETVAQDAEVSFQAALWFWMDSDARVHQVMASGKGFGETIRAINGGECNGKNANAVNARVKYYKDYCQKFGVDPGNNLTC